MLETIDDALTTAVKDIAKQHEGHFLAVQAFLGDEDEPGFLRRAHATEDGLHYEDRMSDFVKLFGRDSLIIEYLPGYKRYVFEITQKNDRPLEFQLGTDSARLELSPKFTALLCPAPLIEKFRLCLDAAAKHKLTDSPSARKQFDDQAPVCIANAREVISSDARTAWVDSYKLRTERHGDADVIFWSSLRRIMLTLLFLDFLTSATGSGSALKVGFSINVEKNSDANTKLVLLSSPLLERGCATTRSAITDTFKLLKNLHDEVGDFPLGLDASRVLKGVDEDLGLGEGPFSIESQCARSESQLTWSMAIAEELYDAIHEGAQLDFYFLIAEETEIRDSPACVFSEFEEEDFPELDSLALPNTSSDEEYKQMAKAASADLSHEHFPWFRNGRSALLFSVSSNDRKPRGLVRLSHADWSSVVRKTFLPYSRLETTIPASYLVFCRTKVGVIELKPGDEDGSTERTERTELERRYYYVSRDKRWTNASDDQDHRQEPLRCVLRRCVNKTKAEYLTKLALRAADDPEVGGTIVIAEDSGSFLAAMGEHWKTCFADEKSLRAEDHLALLSHDGATLVTPAGDYGDWAFRRLLMTSVTRSVQVRIDSFNEGDGDGGSIFRPFKGKGARRFSAGVVAIANLEPVKAIIVISQDGDITLWSKANDSVCCQELRIAENSEVQCHGD